MASVERKRRWFRRGLSRLARTSEVIRRLLSPVSPASSTLLEMMLARQCPSSPIKCLAFSREERQIERDELRDRGVVISYFVLLYTRLGNGRFNKNWTRRRYLPIF